MVPVLPARWSTTHSRPSLHCQRRPLRPPHCPPRTRPQARHPHPVGRSGSTASGRDGLRRQRPGHSRRRRPDFRRRRVAEGQPVSGQGFAVNVVPARPRRRGSRPRAHGGAGRREYPGTDLPSSCGCKRRCRCQTLSTNGDGTIRTDPRRSRPPSCQPPTRPASSPPSVRRSRPPSRFRLRPGRFSFAAPRSMPPPSA